MVCRFAIVEDCRVKGMRALMGRLTRDSDGPCCGDGSVELTAVVNVDASTPKALR